MARRSPTWRRYLPNIAFRLQVPLLSISTQLLYESYEQLTVEFTRVEVKLWKWSFGFRLYWRNPS